MEGKEGEKREGSLCPVFTPRMSKDKEKEKKQGEARKRRKYRNIKGSCEKEARVKETMRTVTEAEMPEDL